MHGTTIHLLEPLAWLVLLVSLYFSSDRRAKALKRGGFETPKGDRPVLRHRVFGLLTCTKIVATLGALLAASSLLHMPMHVAVESALGWAAFVVVVACSYAVAAEIIRDAMEPMPALAEPVLSLLRWMGSLVLGVVVLASLPLLQSESFLHWLHIARMSCALCVFALEAGLAGLLLMNLRALGLFVRSRSVGLALGLAALGCSDLIYALGAEMSGVSATEITMAAGLVMFVAVATWAFFIVSPDRDRLPHQLNPRGLLMTWKELAPQFASALRPVEKAPFIAGIEARVQSVLAKYGVETGVR